MIRRVLSHPSSPSGLSIAGLPPGTPTVQPLQQVIILPAMQQIGTIPADALVTSDGAPIYRTGPAHWGQVVQAGRIQ